jgi:hypothetical protein
MATMIWWARGRDGGSARGRRQGGTTGVGSWIAREVAREIWLEGGGGCRAG